MKRTVFRVLLLSLTLLMLACCSQNPKEKLSAMSDEKQIEFLKEAGVEFPA